MQRDILIQQLKEEAKKVEQHLLQLRQNEPFTHSEAEQFLNDVEKLYRNLAAYAYALKSQGDLDVHLKIMQRVPPIEPPIAPKKKEEPAQLTIEEKVEEIIANETKENLNLKRIDFSINDRFRIINELFEQSQTEFLAALQQLNAITTLEESMYYLNSLKEVYSWKKDSDLVKNLYTQVNKRFI